VRRWRYFKPRGPLVTTVVSRLVQVEPEEELQAAHANFKSAYTYGAGETLLHAEDEGRNRQKARDRVRSVLGFLEEEQ